VCAIEHARDQKFLGVVSTKVLQRRLVDGLSADEPAVEQAASTLRSEEQRRPASSPGAYGKFKRHFANDIVTGVPPQNVEDTLTRPNEKEISHGRCRGKHAELAFMAVGFIDCR